MVPIITAVASRPSHHSSRFQTQSSQQSLPNPIITAIASRGAVQAPLTGGLWRASGAAARRRRRMGGATGRGPAGRPSWSAHCRRRRPPRSRCARRPSHAPSGSRSVCLPWRRLGDGWGGRLLKNYGSRGNIGKITALSVLSARTDICCSGGSAVGWS